MLAQACRGIVRGQTFFGAAAQLLKHFRRWQPIPKLCKCHTNFPLSESGLDFNRRGLIPLSLLRNIEFLFRHSRMPLAVVRLGYSPQANSGWVRDKKHSGADNFRDDVVVTRFGSPV
jgi:hypothetical protein